MRVVRQWKWKWLPGKAVEALSLEMFPVRLVGSEKHGVMKDDPAHGNGFGLTDDL